MRGMSRQMDLRMANLPQYSLLATVVSFKHSLFKVQPGMLGIEEQRELMLDSTSAAAIV